MTAPSAGWSFGARAACGDLRAEIFALPFFRALADGTLPEGRFAAYLRQDALYLPAYAQAMRRLAGRLPEGPERELFGHFADDGVAAEQSMQAAFLAERGGGGDAEGGPSEACRRSIAHVRRMGEEAPLPVALAGVLPCFDVYAEAGARLAAAVGETGLAGHPYGRWIAAYAGGGFAADAEAAAALCDGYARRHPGARPAMLDAYRAGVRLERDFWAFP